MDTVWLHVRYDEVLYCVVAKEEVREVAIKKPRGMTFCTRGSKRDNTLSGQELQKRATHLLCESLDI
jgi:TnpA family transposase